MVLAGHRLVRFYGFGVQTKFFSPTVIVWVVFVALETEDTCVEGRVPVPGQLHLSWDRSHTWAALDRTRTGGVGF